MKTCADCGEQHPDEATSCQLCGAITFVSSSPEAIGGHIISPEEQRFWKRMTFRQFAALFLRIQSIWFIFNGVLDLTYLPTYSAVSGVRQFMAVLRILLNFAMGVACMQYAESFVSWLVKGLIPMPLDHLQKPTPNDSGKSTSQNES